MIALTAQDVGWKQTRMGKFTASTIGQLMTSPRNKADREAG
jgi:Zn-dependent M32 family carboxypeptidase